MIRNNVNIKGIKMNEIEVILSQFADDTSIFLDGSEKSFRETISTLDRFSSYSGLKINIDKTNVIWIGCKKNCGTRYMRDRNFLWDPGIFKVLGIQLSTAIHNIVDLNYKDKIEKLKRIFKLWGKRQLTPLGKITVMKSLIISTITHLLINIPDPPHAFMNDLNKEMYNFLWDGKKNKLRKDVIGRPLEKGGLGMMDINSFLGALKSSWIGRVWNNVNLQYHISNLYPKILEIKNRGSEFTKEVVETIENPFWKDVCRYYEKLQKTCKIQDLNEFLAENIHYNPNIIQGKKTVVIRTWLEAGITKIHHLISDHGELMSQIEFKKKCTQTLTLISYNMKGL